MARQPPQLAAQQRALGRHLAALREAAGLYQADIARAVPCHRTTVTHAEAGSQLPDSHFWETADRAVGANGTLLAAYDAFMQAKAAHRAEQQAQRRAKAQSTAQEMRTARPPNTLAFGNLGGPLGEWSTTLAVGGFPTDDEPFSAPDVDFDEVHHVAAALADARRYLDGSVVDYFRRQLGACTAEDGTLGPTKALPAVLGILGAIEQRAREVKPDARRALLSVGALGAEFGGWLYRDIHRPQRAAFWYGRATEWAQEAGDTAAQGYILLKKSQMAYDNRDALRVLTLAQAAQYGPCQLPRQVRAEVTQQEARGLAMLGEPMSIIEQKLDDARRLLADATPDDEQHNRLGSSFTDGTLTLRIASCYMEAGKPRQAAALYSQVLSADLLSRRDRGYFLARLASSLALAGEPDDAAGAGLEAAQLATATTSQRTKRELMRALATLKPWHNRPRPRALRQAVMTSTAPVTNPPSATP